MKKAYQSLLLGTANILALGVSAQDATMLAPKISDAQKQNQTLTEGQLRSIEASHLEVYAGCKWGKASFDAVPVESEVAAPEIQSLFEQMVSA